MSTDIRGEMVLLAVFIAPTLAMLLWAVGPRWWYVRKLPPPAVGQVWRSTHSGRRIRISGVNTMDDGTIEWNYQVETSAAWAIDGFNPLSNSQFGLRSWWEMLYTEKRVLESTP